MKNQVNKIFDVHLIWCNIVGNWYTYEAHTNYDHEK